MNMYSTLLMHVVWSCSHILFEQNAVLYVNMHPVNAMTWIDLIIQVIRIYNLSQDNDLSKLHTPFNPCFNNFTVLLI